MSSLLKNAVSNKGPSDEEISKKYGLKPKKNLMKNLQDRKYFDSADYAVSKAGKGDSIDAGSVGSEHPVPENIPHLASPNGAQSNSGLPLPHHGSISGQSISPIKESSFLHRESSADDAEEKTAAEEPKVASEEKGIPIRR